MSNQEYKVESIVDVRISRGKKEYLIKWENYDHSENTWEPLSNLINVTYMIREFELNRLESDKDIDQIISSCNSNTEFEEVEEDEKIPDKVLKIKEMDGILYSKIYYKDKPDGTSPDSEWILNTFLAEKYPEVLIKYYEDNIKFST